MVFNLPLSHGLAIGRVSLSKHLVGPENPAVKVFISGNVRPSAGRAEPEIPDNATETETALFTEALEPAWDKAFRHSRTFIP